MSIDINLEQFPKQAQYYAKEQLSKQKQSPLYPTNWLIGVAKKYCISQRLPYPGSVDLEEVAAHPIYVAPHDPTNRNRGLINEYHRAEALKDSPQYAKGTQLDSWWVDRLKAEGLPTSLDMDYVLQIKIDEIIKHKKSNDPTCENSVWSVATQLLKPCAFWQLSQNTEYLDTIKAQWRIVKDNHAIKGPG